MTNQISFPPLLDLSPGEFEAHKQHLVTEIAQPPERRWPSLLSVPPLRLRFAIPAVAVVVAAVSSYVLASPAQSPHPRTSGPVSTVPGVYGPAKSPTPVSDAAAADALLPFHVVLPSTVKPTSLGVYASQDVPQLSGYFDTPSTGPYVLVEQPVGNETVALLEQTAKQWKVGPIHKIVLVGGVHVLLQGSSDGSLTATWIRGNGATPVLTWIQGPEDATHGQLMDQTFTEQQALSVAANIIGQGG